MTTATTLLGTSTNLVKGYGAGWDPANGKLDIVTPAAQIPMTTEAPDPIAARGDWGYPEISLHETAESLIGAVLGHRVVSPAIDVTPPDLPAGVLSLHGPNGAASRSALSQALGVSLDDAGLRYALVKLRRVDGQATHKTRETGVIITVNALNPDPEIGVNGAFMRAWARLRHFPAHDDTGWVDQLTAEDANAYLAMFRDWGTHYVSAMDLGDEILQVFAYKADRFARVTSAIAKGNSFEGAKAADFAYFTTDANRGEFGFVAQFGNLLCLSNSKAFTQSVSNGQWLDSLWAKQDSILQVVAGGMQISLHHLDQMMTEQVPIGVELAPLTTFTEYKRTAIWRRVLKAALSTTFGTAINVNFAEIDTTDFSAMLPDDQPGVLSTLATPDINVYKARLDLGDMQLVARDQVKRFTTLGYVVSARSSAPLALPGTTVELFGYILDLRATGKPNVLTLSDAGYDSLTIGCRRFLGAAILQNDAGSKRAVIVDGLRYEAGEGCDPAVVGDVRTPPPADTIGRLGDSLEFSMAFAEAVLGLQTGAERHEVQDLARGYLAWVAQTIPAGTNDEDLLHIRVRALDLGHYAVNASIGSFVPILPASDYQQYVERILDYLDQIQTEVVANKQQIDARKQAELTIDVAKTLNANIVQTGGAVTGLIEANARQQTDLANQYESIIQTRKTEASAQQAKIDDLEGMLRSQQFEVDAEVQGYKSKVEQWETMQWVKFGLDLATTVFSIGTSIAIPANSINAVKDLGLAAQRIQKTLNVLNNTMKLYSTVKGSLDNLGNAEKTLDGLEGMEFGDTAQLSWDEMSINFDQVMATGPNDPQVNAAKAGLVAAFKTLIARGKALTGAKSQLHQIQRDIYTTQRQKELNQRQAKRLADVAAKFDPAKIDSFKPSEVDLVGLTGHLEYLRQQMLATLAKAFLLQDQALQYANLQPSTPILSYSLLKFRGARVAQQQAAITARSKLGQYQASTTTPIVYSVESIATADISSGAWHRIVIAPDAAEFLQYVNLRVVSVVAEVEGITGTESGSYLVRLGFQTAPFTDRDTERQPLVFHTPWRERTYEFDATTGKPKFTDGGTSWSDGISRVTPFGEWHVDLPKTKTNRGITFGGPEVTVKLTFVLEARIVDAPAFRGHGHSARTSALRTETLRLAAMAASPDLAAAAQPSPTALISQMASQGTVTNGWDVVFNMGRSSINNALRSQYDQLKNDTAYKNVIDVDTKTKVVEGVWSIRKFHMEYGYPRLTFSVNNNETVRLEMPIEKGSLTNCIQTGSDPEKCDPPVSISGKSLTANVKLSKVQGTTELKGQSHNVLKVVLDMEEGAFNVADIEISDEEKVELNKAIKAYFSQNKVVYIINELDLTNVPVIEAMRPNAFLFKVLKTPSGTELLQLFIQTGTRSPLDYSQTFLNNVPEPLPQGQECTLIVRSALFFGTVLPASMSRTNWMLAGRSDSGHPGKASWGEFTSAVVSATGIDLSKLTQSGGAGGQGGGSSWITTYSFPNNTVSWNLSGMTLKPSSGGEMKLSGKKTQSMRINTQTVTTHWPCFWNCTRRSNSSFTNDATSNVSASAPVSVSGAGRKQSIAIAMRSQQVSVSGHLAGGGPSGSDDLQAQVNQQVKAQVPDQIKKQLSVSFDSVALFAIQNLLFPSNDYIQFSQAAVPGDALVIGNFQNLASVG